MPAFLIQRLREVKKWAGSKEQTLMADAKAQAQLPHLLNSQRTASGIFFFLEDPRRNAAHPSKKALTKVS